MKTAEFGQPAAVLPQPGRCRICGCAEDRACLVTADHRYCGWADHTRTLCDNPRCIREAKAELGLPV